MHFLSFFKETDFVCFDTGHDRFDIYDVDLLLGSSATENDSEDRGTSDQIEVADGLQEDTNPSEEDAIDGEKLNKPYISEDIGMVSDDQSASLPPLAVANESYSKKEIGPDTAAIDDIEIAAEDKETHRQTADSVHETVDPAKSETKDTPTKHGFVSEDVPVSISEGVQIPKLNTTFGTMFDAVTTDEDTTTKITPYEEEESETFEDHPEDYSDVESPLLLSSEEAADSPASASLKDEEYPGTAPDDKPKSAEEKGMWSSLGDAVLSVVTGGEWTEDLSSEEDEDDENEAVSETPLIYVEAKKDEELEEPGDIDPVLKDLPDSMSVQTDNKETTGDFEKLLFDHEEAVDERSIQHEADETLKPTDEPIQHQEEAVLFDPSSHIETTNEAIEDEKEDEVTKYSEGNIDEYLKDPSIVMEHREDENNTMMDHELVATETHQDLSTKETQSQNSLIRDDNETIVDDFRLDQYNDNLNTDVENKNRPGESLVQNHEELLPEDEKYTEIDEEKLEEKEELLEDENALSLSQSDDADTDKHSPEPELEPEYSDSVLRLTLLQGHFITENMARFQKYLGLKNLYKVEAMFSDLDLELQATRLSQSVTTQDIENALESILEASENTILDEIERMLDNRVKKHSEHQVDARTLDEETEILDDFQEFAFSLRQKYSTASDSTPLAGEKASDIVEGRFVFFLIIPNRSIS